MDPAWFTTWCFCAVLAGQANLKNNLLLFRSFWICQQSVSILEFRKGTKHWLQRPLCFSFLLFQIQEFLIPVSFLCVCKCTCIYMHAKARDQSLGSFLNWFVTWHCTCRVASAWWTVNPTNPPVSALPQFWDYRWVPPWWTFHMDSGTQPEVLMTMYQTLCWLSICLAPKFPISIYVGYNEELARFWESICFQEVCGLVHINRFSHGWIFNTIETGKCNIRFVQLKSLLLTFNSIC